MAIDGAKPEAGRPSPLGPTMDRGGVNFALFSAHAEKVELCLFEDGREICMALADRTGDIWHLYLPGAGPGLAYGYRVHGPYDPEAGHRFNPHKLLIDPYARALDRPFVWDDIHCGYRVGDERGDLSFDTRDNSASMPKCLVIDPAFDWTGDARPMTPAHRSTIYELHLRGFTMRHPGIAPSLRGTAAALGAPEIVSYLKALGISAIELLPVQAAATTRALDRIGLRDYWGYNSIAFFAPEARYLAGGPGQISEFKHMVRAFHDAGIEVILDVVFNHTGEGHELGPTLSFRGIDNASYYCLAEDPRRYLDFTGCDNTLDLSHPRVREMVLDCLRYWTEEMHVDGFRFDLAVTLAREDHHFSPNAAFFDGVRQDPVLAGVKLIAEPWDLGPDGYRLGGFPAGWSEWNDRYRDTMRRFWRGDRGLRADFARRLAGSSDLFAGRGPAASVNFVTAHDGFTLQDLVSYAAKHNQANGEDNRDGADENFSANYGVEGESEDPAIARLRLRQKRNLVSTLFFSEGMPMLAAGDEGGRTQHGNNNAYCQDNETSWFDWAGADPDFLAFVRRVIELRARFGAFRRAGFFAPDGREIVWLSPGGRALGDGDWDSPETATLGMRYAGTEGGPELLLLVNPSDAPVDFALPGDVAWAVLLDTARDDTPDTPAAGSHFMLAEKSLALLAETGGARV